MLLPFSSLAEITTCNLSPTVAFVLLILPLILRVIFCLSGGNGLPCSVTTTFTDASESLVYSTPLKDSLIAPVLTDTVCSPALTP